MVRLLYRRRGISTRLVKEGCEILSTGMNLLQKEELNEGVCA